MCHSVEMYLPEVATRTAREHARDYLPDESAAPVPSLPGRLTRILALLRRNRVEEGAAAAAAE
jgi:hypothetical protein